MGLTSDRHEFRVGGRDAVVTVRAGRRGLATELSLDGRMVAEDRTPLTGAEALRNHRLATVLDDGRRIEIDVGAATKWTTGVAGDLDGARVHESHPGRRLGHSDRIKRMASAEPDYDREIWRKNRIPVAVDIALGLLFYVVAKATDLPTAAIVGAAVGIGLVVLQRFIRTDILGGLALFGIVMLLLSAGLAVAFQDDMAVKMRTTILGLISAGLFLGDGLVLRGRRLGRGMARYLPYKDVDPARLSIGMGSVGLLMAALNTLVARYASTDAWLFYSTFVDFGLIMLLVVFVFRYARRGPAAGAAASR